MPSTYKTVQYRRFDSTNAEGTSLEELVREKLNESDDNNITLWRRVRDRIWADGGPEGFQFVLNRVADLQEAVFCEACILDVSGVQAILELAEADVDLSQITTTQIFGVQEQLASENTRFIKGFLYALVVGDHILFVQVQGAKFDTFQEYIGWFVGQTPTFRVGGYDGSFRAAFDPSEVGGEPEEIRQVRVRSQAQSPELEIRLAQDNIPSRERSVLRRLQDRVANSDVAVAVSRLVYGDSLTDGLMDRLGPREFLEVDTTLKVRGTRAEPAGNRLSELATAAASIDDATVHIAGRDGEIRDGDVILRTKMPFDLQDEARSLLDFDNVADQLQTVYARFVEDGKIAP